MAYVIVAYGVVLITLVVYALRLRSRRAALLQELRGSPAAGDPGA